MLNSTSPEEYTRAPIMFVAFRGMRSADGGINSLYEIASRIEDKRWLVTQRDDKGFERWQGSGVQIKVIEYNKTANTLSRIREFFNWRRQFATFVKQVKPGVIICNDIQALVLAGPIAKQTGTPNAFYVRDIFEPNRNYTFKWRMAARYVDLAKVAGQWSANQSH